MKKIISLFLSVVISVVGLFATDVSTTGSYESKDAYVYLEEDFVTFGKNLGNHVLMRKGEDYSNAYLLFEENGCFFDQYIFDINENLVYQENIKSFAYDEQTGLITYLEPLNSEEFQSVCLGVLYYENGMYYLEYVTSYKEDENGNFIPVSPEEAIKEFNEKHFSSNSLERYEYIDLKDLDKKARFKQRSGRTANLEFEAPVEFYREEDELVFKVARLNNNSAFGSGNIIIDIWASTSGEWKPGEPSTGYKLAEYHFDGLDAGFGYSDLKAECKQITTDLESGKTYPCVIRILEEGEDGNNYVVFLVNELFYWIT